MKTALERAHDRLDRRWVSLSRELTVRRRNWLRDTNPVIRILNALSYLLPSPGHELRSTTTIINTKYGWVK